MPPARRDEYCRRCLRRTSSSSVARSCRRRFRRNVQSSAARGAAERTAQMKPEIHILGISIKTFGVAFACAFIACGAVVARRLRELGKPVDWAYEIIFAALLGGVIGARGYYLIQNYDQVKHDLLGNIFSGS